MKNFKLFSTLAITLLSVSLVKADDLEVLNSAVAVDGHCQYKRIALFDEHVNSSTPDLVDSILDIVVELATVEQEISSEREQELETLKSSLAKLFPANTIRGQAITTEALDNGNFLSREFYYWGDTMPNTPLLKVLPPIDDKVDVMELARQIPKDVLVVGYVNGNLGAGISAVISAIPEVKANYELLKQRALEEHGVDIGFIEVPGKSDILFYLSLSDLEGIMEAENELDVFHAEVYLTPEQLKGLGVNDESPFTVTATENGSILELKGVDNGAKMTEGSLAEDELFAEMVKALPSQECNSFIYISPNNLSDKYMINSSKIFTGLVTANVTENGILYYISSRFPGELLDYPSSTSGRNIESIIDEFLSADL